MHLWTRIFVGKDTCRKGKDICQLKLKSTAGKITLMHLWTFVGKVEKPAGLLADNEIVIEQSVFCKDSFLSHLICSVQWLSMLDQCQNSEF